MGFIIALSLQANCINRPHRHVFASVYVIWKDKQRNYRILILGMGSFRLRGWRRPRSRSPIWHQPQLLWRVESRKPVTMLAAFALKPSVIVILRRYCIHIANSVSFFSWVDNWCIVFNYTMSIFCAGDQLQARVSSAMYSWMVVHMNLISRASVFCFLLSYDHL
jgi:hypothetical protein